MSFILDALRKSENERARGSGPALLESRVVPRRRAVPLWAVIVGVILLANLAVLAVVLWRRPASSPASATTAQLPAPAPAPAPGQPPAYPAPGTVPPGAYPPAGYAGQPAYAPPAGYPAQQAYPGQQGYPAAQAYPPPQGYANPPGYPPPQPYSPPQLYAPPQGYVPPAYPPAGAPGGANPANAPQGGSASVVNPADYQPARPPSRPASPAGSPSTAPASAAGDPADALLPSASDLTASGAGLPEQRLALHSFDANPAGRFVLLNSQRLREGETSSEGVRIERITPEGAIASWRGRRFRLTPGE